MLVYRYSRANIGCPGCDRLELEEGCTFHIVLEKTSFVSEDIILSWYSLQEEDAVLAEMEFTGQAFEEMQEQNVRLLQQLREKDDANLKLMSEV